MLNVSFEIAYDTLLVADGIEYIDASPNNIITGMAIVSRPAYPEAVATRLVAGQTGADPTEAGTGADNTHQEQNGGVNEMTMDEAVGKIADLEGEVQALREQ